MPNDDLTTSGPIEATSSDTDVAQITGLSAMIARAADALAGETTPAEFLDAIHHTTFAYDAAVVTARLHKARDAHAEIIAACRKAQGDAIEIQGAAQVRLADEYDAAQGRGEAARPGEYARANIPNQNISPTVTDIGLTSKIVHEARQVRDAERRDPGIIRRTVAERLNAGEAPTHADIRRAISPRPRIIPTPTPVTPVRAPMPAAPQPTVPDPQIAALTMELATAKARIVQLEAAAQEPLDRIKRTLEYDYEVRARRLENEYIARMAQQARDSVTVPISDDVQTEVNRWLELLLAELHKERSKARKAVAKRKRVMTKTAFNKVMRAVHPDTGGHATENDRNAATRALNALKPYVLDEADEPTRWDSDLPDDLAGWARRMQEAELARRMRDIPHPRGMPIPPFLVPRPLRRR